MGSNQLSECVKEAKIRRFRARHPESVCRPYLLKKLYPYIFDGRTGRPNAFLFGFFKKGLEQVDSSVYSHLIRWQDTFFRTRRCPIQWRSGGNGQHRC